MAEERRREYEKEPAAGSDGDRKSLKEIISDITEQELTGCSDEAVSAEQLKSMEKEYSLRLKRRRLIGAAAAFFVFIAGALLVSVNLPADVDADKNAPEEIVSEDGVVIEDGGWGSSGDTKIITDDWDEVEIIKEDFDKLMIPQYIPDGYKFVELSIDIMEGENSAGIFKFSNGHSDLEIHEFFSNSNLDSTEIQSTCTIEDEDIGKVYIDDSNEIIKAASIVNGSFIVEIWGTENINVLIQIIRSLD